MFIKLTLFILTLCFIIIHTVLYIFAVEREKFEEPVLIVADNPSNVKNAVKIDSITYERIIDSIRYSGKIDKSIIGSGRKVEFYVDPYIDHFIFKSTRRNDVYKDGIFVCLSYKKLDTNDCIWNLEGKVVAYAYVSDYLFIQALMKAYRLDPNKVQLKKIAFEDLRSAHKQFDYYITYVVLDSEYKTFLENSLYYINGFKDVDVNRIKPFYPFIKENYNSMRYYFSNEKFKDYINKENSVLIPMMNHKIIRETTESFITRLEKPEGYIGDEEKTPDRFNSFAGGYGCYGNANILNNKYECDSLYNIDGTPKTYYSIWDKRCTVNTDCPYYKANTKYPNERGGCVNGSCEFPVGVKRLGFMKYDDAGLNSPLCYDCTNMNDVDCCKRIKKETGKTPDYVFSDDFQDRVKNNLNIIISLLEYRVDK